MRNEERIEGRNGKGGELRYIRIWQGMEGAGVESRVTGKWDVRATGDQFS